MEFINLISKTSQVIVSAFGAGIAAAGAINFSEGKSQQSQGKQDEGMSKLVGGGAIILIGYFLVPEIFKLLVM